MSGRPPKLVSASAGTGKTFWVVQTLCDRLAQGLALDELAAVTFTDAAAHELRERLRAELFARGMEEHALRVESAAVCTIHTFSLLLLQRHGLLAGLRPEPMVLDEVQGSTLLREAVAAAVREADDEVTLSLLGMLGETMGLAERGFTDAATPEGRLHSLLRRVCETARALAMGPGRLRGEAEASAQRLEALLGGASDSELVESKFASALREAQGARRSLGTAPAKKDEKLFALLHDLALEDGGEPDALTTSALRLSCFDPEGAASKKFPQGESLLLAAGEFVRRHPAVRDRLGDFVRSLLALAASVLERFQSAKARLGALDFEDMQLQALELLRGADGRASLRGLVAGSLKVLVVDEFQDTSPLQFRLFETLREAGVETTYVGDLKQAIYGFRMADSSLFAALLADAHARGELPTVLGTNWRSTPALVAFANALFEPALASAGMALDAASAAPAPQPEPPGLGPAVHLLRHPHTEPKGMKRAAQYTAGRWLLDAVESQRPLVRDRESGAWRGVRPGDVAVLCRTHGQLSEWAASLRALGLPVQYGEGALFETVEAQLARAWLRMVASSRDAASCAMVLLSELYGLRQSTVARLASLGATGTPRRALALPTGEGDALTPFERRALERCERELTAARYLLRRRPLAEAVALTLGSIELVERCTVGCTEHERERAYANVGRVVELAEVLSQQGERALRLSGNAGATLESLLVSLDRARDDEAPVRPLAGAQAVTLMTLHRAKGLEFPVVVLDALRETLSVRLPRVEVHRPAMRDAARDPDWLEHCGLRVLPELKPWPLVEHFTEAFDAVADERREWLRLLYVGVTRARDQLMLLWPEPPKTPSATRVARDLLVPPVLPPPLVVGDATWAMSHGAEAIPVRVHHAAPPPEGWLAAPAIERVEPGFEQALEAMIASELPAQPPPAPAPPASPRAVSVSELLSVDECPVAPLVRLRYPGKDAAISPPVPAHSRAVGVALETPEGAREQGAAWGTWAHRFLERWVRRWPERPAPEALLEAARELGMDAPLEPAARWLGGALDSVFGALSALGARELVGLEVPFVLALEGAAVRGAIDLLVRAEQGLVVLDYKSGLGAGVSGGLAPAYALQLDVYALALEALGQGPVAGRYVVTLGAGELVGALEPFAPGRTRERIKRALSALRARPSGPWDDAQCAGCGWAPRCPERRGLKS